MPRHPSELVDEVPKDLEGLCLELLRPEPNKRPTGVEILHRLAAQEAHHHHPLLPWAPSATEFSTSDFYSARFVGRNRELTDVRNALEKVQAGRGTAVFIEGESGVGKSALMRACLDSLSEAVVLESRCYERESIRYKGVDGIVDALTRYFLTLPPGEVEAIVPSKAHLLTRMFPVLGRVEAFSASRNAPSLELDPIRLRMQTFGAFRELLWRLAERVTLVIAVDDLQWADADSILLLSDTLRTPDGPPLLFLATLRLSAESMAVAAAFEGRILEEFHRYQLEPLAPHDAQELARALATSGDTASADAIAKDAGGHPLFIAELARAIRHGEKRRAQSLDEALWERIQHLPEEAQTILRLAAVAGHPLEQELLAEAASAKSFAEFSDHVSTLRNAMFVRTSGVRPSNTLEPYHDRVREAITSHLDNSAQVALHRSLAVMFEKPKRQQQVKPETLAIHWRAAGELEKAANYAAEAGWEASNSLAFERAVTFYQMALELNSKNARAIDWQIRLAEALANLGRSAEAGECYLSALKTAEPHQSFELRRRAADQLLRSGRVDEGLGILRLVLASIGMKLPKTKTGTVAATLAERMKLWLHVKFRGLGIHSLAEAPPDESTLQQINVSWSTAIGLFFVDLFRGSLFHAKTLLLSLKTGHADSLVPSLALQSIYHAAQGRNHRAAAVRLLSIARDLARQTNQPLAQGWTLLAAGFSAVDGGHYRQAVETLTSATHHFRSHCRGAIWESEFAEFYATYACLSLGDLKETKDRLQSLIGEATARGNLFASLQGRIIVGHTLNLADDKVEQSRTELRQALTQWNRDDFGLLRAFALNARTNIAIYAGTLHEEYESWRRDWTLFDRSTFARSESVFVWMKETQARTFLSLATTDISNWRTLTAKVAKLAKQIGICSIIPSRALESLLLSQVAYLYGEGIRAIKHLQDSLEEFERAEMQIYSTALRIRRSQLLANRSGAIGSDQMHDLMKNLGIANPERMLRMLTPGFHRPVFRRSEEEPTNSLVSDLQ